MAGGPSEAHREDPGPARCGPPVRGRKGRAHYSMGPGVDPQRPPDRNQADACQGERAPKAARGRTGAELGAGDGGTGYA